MAIRFFMLFFSPPLPRSSYARSSLDDPVQQVSAARDLALRDVRQFARLDRAGAFEQRVISLLAGRAQGQFAARSDIDDAQRDELVQGVLGGVEAEKQLGQQAVE